MSNVIARRIGAVLCVSVVMCIRLPLASALTLVEPGQPPAAICVKADAPQAVQDAAAELAQVLGKMTGAEFPVAKLAAASELAR